MFKIKVSNKRFLLFENCSRKTIDSCSRSECIIMQEIEITGSEISRS
jgi:hypothetical protein